MVSKKHEAIVFYLLVSSILVLALISISFKYYFPDEIPLFETDEELEIYSSISFNESFFDTNYQLFKISLSDLYLKYSPETKGNAVITINSNITQAVSGPSDYIVYRGEIYSVEISDAGLAITFHLRFSALRNRNPIYISLTTLTCVLALYYFHLTTYRKKEEKALEKEK